MRVIAASQYHRRWVSKAISGGTPAYQSSTLVAAFDWQGMSPY